MRCNRDIIYTHNCFHHVVFPGEEETSLAELWLSVTLIFNRTLIENYSLNQVSFMKWQEQGFQIIPWTVNETQDMNAMIGLKVDGIITDYPDRLLKILN